jgi:choline dehydrogenase-like flavoprotein
MYYVIGSGPAAISAAVALSGRDLPVSIVDTGLAPPDSVTAMRQRFAAHDPDSWSTDDLAKLKGRTIANADGVEHKLDFGSDHVYQDVSVAPDVEIDSAAMLRSFARGGLSNVWGASVLPYPESELEDWPIEASTLRPHYKSVLQFVPHSGADDDLSELFPNVCPDMQAMPRSSQYVSLLKDLDRARKSLQNSGIRFGAARLAVDADGKQYGTPCKSCGLCLYGCPYNLIYSASTTLTSLLGRENVDYRAGLWVHSLEPEGSKVRVRVRHIDSGREDVLVADKVFLAAGVVETARIVLESVGQFGTPVEGLHSDRITLPLVRFKRDKGIRSENLHTLSQVFLEVFDENICQEMIHVQIYGYNDLFPGSLAARLDRFGIRGQSNLYDVLLERLMVAFAYLHSRLSSRIEYVLEKDGRLRITGRPSEEAKAASRLLTKSLRRNGLKFGALFGSPKLHPPGGGNHSGGTFPMTRSPGRLQCDKFGELRDFPNLHIVDSSVLPSLSSTTITLPAMANAHRIASEVS